MTDVRYVIVAMEHETSAHIQYGLKFLGGGLLY
jgi:hypothetical protein